ncbi:hypothetical protein AAF712_004814 [Marasmius tenuissimus]|uniref:Uncharacterized protein n=1 Tax=Marasmius tenuissimus TaxID=585030 RepID=A0ABR3A580_9AGAR
MTVPPSSWVSMNSSRVVRTPKTDAFRPNLPSDPFAILEGDRHWTVRYEELAEKLSSKEGMTRNVILILGEPPQTELDSLLSAPSLMDSLLLIVTSSPPQSLVQAPSNPSPFVQILRLSSPTGLQEPSAQNLLSILQRAEVNARQWRKQPEAFNRCSQLRENQPGGAFTVPERYGFNPDNNPYNSLLYNYNHNVAPSPANSAPSRIDISFFSRLGRPDGRSFDALINFVPSSFSDKAILKQIILITTLSQNFLSSPTHSSQVSSPVSDSQSQPPSRAPSPSLRKHTRRAYSISSSISRRFSSLLTSSDVSLPEQNVRQADAAPVITLSSDLPSRPSHLSERAYSSADSVPVVSGSPKMVPLTSEPRSTRSHLIHVLPLCVPTSTPSFQASRTRTSLSGLFSSSEYYSRSHIEDQIQGGGKSKLLESIERFLRSYSYPFSSSVHGANNSSASLRHSRRSSSISVSSVSSVFGFETDFTRDPTAHRVQNERAVAYVVSAGMLSHRPAVSNSVKRDSPAAVAEMLLLGLLDCAHSYFPPKVWIGQPNDVVVKCDAGATRATVGGQEVYEVKMRAATPADSTDGMEDYERVFDGWLRGEANLKEMSVPSESTSIAKRETGPSSPSGATTPSSRTSSAYESPTPTLSTAATSIVEGTGRSPRVVEVKIQESPPPRITAKLRKVSTGWRRLKSVSA